MTNPEHSFEEDVDPTVPETGNYTETLSEADQTELDSLLADVITSEGYTGEPLPQISYKIYYSD